ncbi:MAG: 2-C-methyl-D-erythritol 2,4-cyclodiphosphate synthase [Oscillospiraceae bacterium]|nr:2-C-methyl-D-erythritol 2,4-cyclodiphosphate synthase [Oscillospiraceae bacterium]
MKVGMGYDVHRFAPGRKLILGGVEIPHREGLLGHSDADVLVHAIIDALLGALGLGDIGELFPDSDESYKDADSLLLLGNVMAFAKKSEWGIKNIDCVIIAETPKLTPFKIQMKENIARVCSLAPENVNIKATTEEGLGIAGKGIGAKAILIIESR